MNTSTREISNSEDVIDSRDIIDRIEYLEGLQEDFDVEAEGCEWDSTDDADELHALQELANDAEEYAPLLEELQSIGYNLKVMKRRNSK